MLQVRNFNNYFTSTSSFIINFKERCIYYRENVLQHSDYKQVIPAHAHYIPRLWFITGGVWGLTTRLGVAGINVCVYAHPPDWGVWPARLSLWTPSEGGLGSRQYSAEHAGDLASYPGSNYAGEGKRAWYLPSAVALDFTGISVNSILSVFFRKR